MKLCECGCGEPAPIATKTKSSQGAVKGQPVRFRKGHNGRRPLVERFWEKVARAGPDECWLWTAGVDPKGYARIGGDLAHRVAWELANGPIPDGLCVCHTCDTPPCCKPAHLFLGSQADNLADMRSKGRGFVPQPSIGEQHPSAKLTAAAVRTIREWAPVGWTQYDLAAAFGVSQSLISSVLSRRVWAHI